MIDTDCIHPPRGVERRAKLEAGHSESINADCLEEFEKQRLVVANPFSYNKSTRTGIVAEFDNGYHLSKEVGIKRNFVTIGMRVWDNNRIE